MTPLDWMASDLGMTRWELVKAFLIAPFLLAGLVAFCLLLWAMTP